MAKRPRAAPAGPFDARSAPREASSLLLRYLAEIPALLPGSPGDAAAGVESWLASARAEVGTSSAADAVAFNARNGGGTDHPDYDPVRYLVWSVGSVLLPMLRADAVRGGAEEGDGDGRTAAGRFGDALAGFREAFVDLAGRPHAAPGGDGDADGGSDGDAAGAFWQMLVRSGTGLGPEETTDRLGEFESDFLGGLGGTTPDGPDGPPVEPVSLAHPAFLGMLADGSGRRNKRRRLDRRGGRAAGPDRGDGALRWTLLGYSAAYAVLHVPTSAFPDARAGLSHLSSTVSRTLHRDLGAPARGRERAAVLSGMAAGLLDEVCDWTAVDDGLVESWREGEGDRGEVLEEMRASGRFRAGVDQVVGLILEDPS